MSANEAVQSAETPIVGMRLVGNSGTYRLTRFLGGGQTAAVYAALVEDSKIVHRIGEEVAVKLMIPGLDKETTKRFWQEEDFLIGLNQGLRRLALQGLDAEDASTLVPSVWDRSKDKGPQFLVMTLASGKSLDEFLRSDRRFSEIDSLRIIYQLLAVLLSLHEEVRRVYLDFQPRNVFWDERAKRITVIDWNLLSQSESKDYQPDYSQDIRMAIQLLHRLLVNQESLLSVLEDRKSRNAWEGLSLSTRLLLREIAEPDADTRSSIRKLLDRIGAELTWHRASSDELLYQAADRVEQMTVAKNADAGINEVITHHQRAVALLRLAEGRGISRRMGAIAQDLHEKLDRDALAHSHLTGGQALLRAGDYSQAKELFDKALTEAVTPGELVLARRWWLLSQNPSSEADAQVQELVDLLADAEGQPRQGQLASSAFESVDWQGLKTIAKEMEALGTLADLLLLDIPTLEQSSLQVWIDNAQKAVKVFEDLDSGQFGTPSYGEALWYWLGNGQSLPVTKQRIQDKLDSIAKRQAHTAKIDRETKADLSPQEARALLRETEFGSDPYLHSKILEYVPRWMDDAVNDKELAELLTGLEQGSSTPGIKKQILDHQRSLTLLQEARFWVDWAAVPSVQTGDAHNQIASDSAPEALSMPSGQEENGPGHSEAHPIHIKETAAEITASDQLAMLPGPGSMAAADLALHWLKAVQSNTLEHTSRLTKLTNDFVAACLQQRYTSESIEAWLGRSFPKELKLLTTGINYNAGIIAQKRQLGIVELQIRNAQRQKDRIEADGMQNQRQLTQSLEKLRQNHENDLKRLSDRHEHEVARLTQETQRLLAENKRIAEEQTRRKGEFQEELNRIREAAVQEKEADLRAIENTIAALEVEFQKLDRLAAAEKARKWQEVERQVAEELAPLRAQKETLQAAIVQVENEAMEQRQIYREQILAVETQWQTVKEETEKRQQELDRLNLRLRQKRTADRTLRLELDRYRLQQKNLKTEISRMYADKNMLRDTTWQMKVTLRNLESAIEQMNRVRTHERHALRRVARMLAFGEGTAQDGEFEKVLARHLLERAKTIGKHDFPRDIAEINSAMNDIAELEHIYRVLAYLQFATEQVDFQAEIDVLHDLLEGARLSFRIRYVRTPDNSK